MALKGLLTQQIEIWERLGSPALLSRVVLQCGHEGVAQALPPNITRMRAKECFKNAYVMANFQELDGRGLTYVEGLACRMDFPFPVHHAWTETEDHRVIDPTWQAPEACEYFGISFTHRVLCKEVERSGVYGVLDPGPLNLRLMRLICPDLDSWIDSARAKRKDLNG